MVESAQLLPRQSGNNKEFVKTKGTKEINARISFRLVSCRGPDGQSDYKEDNNQGREGNEAAPRPFLFGLTHVNDKLSTFFSGLCGLPIGGCAEGNA